MARFDVITVSIAIFEFGIKFGQNSKNILYKFEKVIADGSTIERKDAKDFTHHNLETGTNNEY